jgi:UDPglucose 6-dehydrogenase
MSLENAELAKLGVNTFVTTKISFANMLADLCERIPGGDVDVVTEALGLDRRIGRSYLTGGLGYGGPCFPRDNHAMSFLARALGTSAPLAEATDRANREVPGRVLERLCDRAEWGNEVAVLGLAYKPATSVTESSQGVWLAAALAASGARVRAYDPLAGEAAGRELPAEVAIAPSLGEALQGVGLVLVCTPDPAFRNLPLDQAGGVSRKVTVVDFWRFLEEELVGKPNVRYVAAGRSLDDRSATELLMQLWKESLRTPRRELRSAEPPEPLEAGTPV